mgnify:CR=1 FL=1
MAIFKSMFKKTGYIKIGSQPEEKGPSVPDGMWLKCSKCKKMVYREDVKEKFYTCPKCGDYFRIKAKTRLRLLLDKGSFQEWGTDIEEKNPIDFPEYEEKLSDTRRKTGLKEAVTIGKGSICGWETVIGVCDARFLMSSMGYVVGERITQAFEQATEEKLPVILFCCSGGARMQEGIISLMQMAKTTAAIRRHSDAGLLYIPVLTDPTTGGVTASFAMLGDVILAEPGALIGFAGPRVIRQTTGEKLPDGFQRAEFLLEKGMIDAIIERKNMREELGKLLRLHSQKAAETFASKASMFQADPIEEKNSDKENKKEKSAWERVELSRSPARCTAGDYIDQIFEDFTELHGDRCFGDDGAVIGGIATLSGIPVTVIGQQKGKNTRENIRCNFGMASPEGYRKALRLMKQAEKFHRPIICFVDTPGAFCGIEAEERGQGEAIARNLWELAGLKTPVLSIVTGEGGSGGALALAAGDQVWMLENSIYSILSPEGFASILWKDSTKAKEAAALMKLTASDLYEKGIIEQVIPEPENLTPESMWQVAERLNDKICTFLQKYTSLSEEELLETRYARFRKF